MIVGAVGYEPSRIGIPVAFSGGLSWASWSGRWLVITEPRVALDIRTADRVLEIGFGHGRTLARLVALVPRGSVVGIEISEDMVERARRRLRTLVATGAVESRRRMPPRFPAQIVRSIEIFSVRLGPASVYRLYDPREVTTLLENSGFSSVAVERASGRGCLPAVAVRDPS